MVAGMPRVVILKDWSELNDVPVIDSKTGLPIVKDEDESPNGSDRPT